MNRIRNWLCTTDPINIVFILILTILWGGMGILIGPKELLSMMGLGLIFVLILGVILVALHKIVVWAQSHCKENRNGS